MIHTKALVLEVVLLVLLLEAPLLVLSLRKWCAFCGRNIGALGIEALRFGESKTVTAAAEGNINKRVDIIIKQ